MSIAPALTESARVKNIEARTGLLLISTTIEAIKYINMIGSLYKSMNCDRLEWLASRMKARVCARIHTLSDNGFFELF